MGTNSNVITSHVKKISFIWLVELTLGIFSRYVLASPVAYCFRLELEIEFGASYLRELQFTTNTNMIGQEY